MRQFFMSPYYPGRTRKSKALNDLAQRRLRERVANRGSFYLNTNKGNGRLRKKQQLRSPQRLAVFKNDPQWVFSATSETMGLAPTCGRVAHAKTEKCDCADCLR